MVLDKTNKQKNPPFLHKKPSFQPSPFYKPYLGTSWTFLALHPASPPHVLGKNVSIGSVFSLKAATQIIGKTGRTIGTKKAAWGPLNSDGSNTRQYCSVLYNSWAAGVTRRSKWELLLNWNRAPLSYYLKAFFPISPFLYFTWETATLVAGGRWFFF